MTAIERGWSLSARPRRGLAADSCSRRIAVLAAAEPLHGAWHDGRQPSRRQAAAHAPLSTSSSAETTVTERDASSTWMTGCSTVLYCGAILTAVCMREVVAPPISRGSFRPALPICGDGGGGRGAARSERKANRSARGVPSTLPRANVGARHRAIVTNTSQVCAPAPPSLSAPQTRSQKNASDKIQPHGCQQRGSPVARRPVRR